MSDLYEQLRCCLEGRACLMGIGNVDRGDDGFGVRLAEKLLRDGTPDVIVAGATPERHLGRVADEGFDDVIFLDAVDFGGIPGSVVLLNSSEIAARFPQVSTHHISLGLLAKRIEANGSTNVWLLGAQAESLQYGGALTPPVETTVGALSELLSSLRSVAHNRLVDEGIC